MLISFVLLFEIGRAALTCSSSSRLTPYMLASSFGLVEPKDICMTADSSKMLMVGAFFDGTFDFGPGGASAAALELTTSPTLAINAIIGIEDVNNPLIHSAFYADVKACSVYPGSSTDWVIASD